MGLPGLTAPCLLALLVCGEVAQATSTEAQAHADRGLQLYRSGDLKQAEVEFRKAVALSPRDPRYLTYLGSVLGGQGKLRESSSYFEKALSVEPQNLGIRRNLAANQWQMGQLREARANLQLILEIDPADKPTLLLVGMVAEGMGDYPRAREYLEAVPELVGERAEALAALARAYYKTGRPQNARHTLAALSRHPAGPQGVFMGARIAAEEGDFDTAETLFLSISANYPDLSALGYNIALVRYKAGRFRESQEKLLELVRTGRATSEVYVLLGWCYDQENKLEEAVRAFERAIEVSPESETSYLDFAKVLVKKNRLPGALNVVQRAVERLPSSQALHMIKGTIEGKLHYHLDAANSFAQALRIDPSSVEANRELAVAQFRAGMLEEAAATFEEGMRRHPSDGLTYQEYARLLLKLAENGDPFAESRAVAALKTAIRLDSSLSGAHYQLGSLLQAQGRHSEALRHLETAVRLDPQNSGIHYALWRAYRRVGRPREAEQEFEAFRRLTAEEESDRNPGLSRIVP